MKLKMPDIDPAMDSWARHVISVIIPMYKGELTLPGLVAEIEL